MIEGFNVNHRDNDSNLFLQIVLIVNGKCHQRKAAFFSFRSDLGHSFGFHFSDMFFWWKDFFLSLAVVSLGNYNEGSNTTHETSLLSQDCYVYF